ncbi:MAG TPA: MaoC/PaaZ C-terminal domain-containing protein [Candidatus Limnocylindrales bacterium]|nr:MaoC/PaaZ C-terminal domain-containing protein [Candidatus Limnocylindrales bacterium]
MSLVSLEQGQVLPEQVFRVTRADLVRYAGASGDFNQIHWSDRIATSVGLPGVIAHGMYTMALAGQAVAVWAGAADAVVDFGVRFTRPVQVPDTDEGTSVSFTAVVKSVEDGFAILDLTAVCGGEKVLAQARAKIKQV